jgi:hypothetical protein
LGVEHTAEILLRPAGLLPRRSRALIARSTTLAAGPRRLVDIGCEARWRDPRLRSYGGLKRTVLRRGWTRVSLVREDPTDGGERFLDGTQETRNRGRGFVVARLGGLPSTWSSCLCGWATGGGGLNGRLLGQYFVFTILFSNGGDGCLDVAFKIFIAYRKTRAV